MSCRRAIFPLLLGALLATGPGEASGFWIACDLIDAFNAADRAATANQQMLERTAAGDADGAAEAKQRMKEGIQDAAKSAQELLEKTPGTTVNPTPPGVDDLKKGILEGLKDLLRSILGGSQARLTLPPPIPDGAFAAQGPIYIASPAGQAVNIVEPMSIAFDLKMVESADYDGSRGPAPPWFADLAPAVYGIGTFSDAILTPFQVYDPDGTAHVYDAAQLATDLAGDADLASGAFSGSNFTSNIFSLVPDANVNGDQVMFLTITSVNTSTGAVSGTFWTGTSVPEPTSLALLLTCVALGAFQTQRHRQPDR
jgi:hypothetical protein